MEETSVKRSIILVCTAALIVSVVACSGGDDKSTLPSYTGGSSPSSPSSTATSRPPTTPPTATGPVALAASSTYTYGGLKVVVNLPADIPSESRPSMLLFSEFLQGVGRTTAQNKLDPSLTNLASADVVKERGARTGGESVQGIGSVTYTITTVHNVAGRTTLLTGCLDQSQLAQVRQDGSHFFDVGAKNYPTLKLTANINPGLTGLKVTLFTFAVGTC